MSKKGNLDIYQKSRKSIRNRLSSAEARAYENLANGVVLKAVRDYQHMLINLHFNPNDRKSMRKLEDCEIFFRSEWYKFLTTIDCDNIMEMAKKQVIEHDWKPFKMSD